MGTFVPTIILCYIGSLTRIRYFKNTVNFKRRKSVGMPERVRAKSSFVSVLAPFEINMAGLRNHVSYWR